MFELGSGHSVRTACPLAANTRGKFTSIQSANPRTRFTACRPSGVNRYSTCGGTTSCAIRCTRPSLSSQRSVCASIRSLTPPTARRSSAKRCVRSSSTINVNTPQRLVTCLRTSRDGHATDSRSPRRTLPDSVVVPCASLTAFPDLREVLTLMCVLTKGKHGSYSATSIDFNRDSP